jgi:Carboxypeptidase regulatory-like domain
MRCVLPFLFNFNCRENPGHSDMLHHYCRQWSYVLALGILGAHCLLAANTSVTGSVVDDSGHPVAGARVLISHAPSIKPPVPAPPVITGSLAAMVTADANGTFHVDTLSPDQYIACAETSTPGFLDPCHWAASAPAFTISAGQTTSGVKIVMAKGAVLQVHINDGQALLKPTAGPVDFDFQIHVVTSKGFHHGAPIQSSTALGRDHVITIPFDTPVTVRVLSAHLAVNDQSGKAISPMGTSINVPAGTTPSVVGLTITGKK